MDNAPRVLAGRYQVGELIGRGGMAEVHIGHDNRLGRTVAIKILRSDLARDPSFLARFRREAQAAASLNHPAIVAVYDTGEDVHEDATGNSVHVPFIVMEYVEGHTVRDILRDGQAVPIDEAVEITAGVLAALEYSHHAGIVHRDIKPANVMITPTGAVKVMDFGIARAVADSAATMTQTQAVIGTAQYLSRSRRAARRSTRAPTCTRPAACSTSCSRGARRSSATRPSRSPTSTCARRPPRRARSLPTCPGARPHHAQGARQGPHRAVLERSRVPGRPRERGAGGSITAPALGVAAAAAGLGAAAAAADLQPTMVESATQVMTPAAAAANPGRPARRPPSRRGSSLPARTRSSPRAARASCGAHRGRRPRHRGDRHDAAHQPEQGRRAGARHRADGPGGHDPGGGRRALRRPGPRSSTRSSRRTPTSRRASSSARAPPGTPRSTRAPRSTSGSRPGLTPSRSRTSRARRRRRPGSISPTPGSTSATSTPRTPRTSRRAR